jgi:hypothetical protein
MPWLLSVFNDLQSEDIGEDNIYYIIYFSYINLFAHTHTHTHKEPFRLKCQQKFSTEKLFIFSTNLVNVHSIPFGFGD